VQGPQLAQAHRDVGRALASTIAGYLPLDEVEIEHVTGRSTGVRVRAGSEPIVVALLRAGLFVAEGIWERLPGSALVLHNHGGNHIDAIPAGRLVVVVDAVINTGRSLRAILDQVGARGAERVVVVALVGYRPAVEALAMEMPGVDFVAARLSDHSYVGRGGTDTGARLLGTAEWRSER